MLVLRLNQNLLSYSYEFYDCRFYCNKKELYKKYSSDVRDKAIKNKRQMKQIYNTKEVIYENKYF